MVKLTNIEFVKAHSKGPLDLYTWTQNEQVSGLTEEGVQSRIMPAMKQFIRSLKIKYFNGPNDNLEIVKLIKDEVKPYENGLQLILSQDETMINLHYPWLQPDTKEVVVIVPMKLVSSIDFSDDETTGPYQYFHDFFESALDHLDLRVDDFVIASTHKPCVANDFMIFQISLKNNLIGQGDRINRKRSMSSQSESESPQANSPPKISKHRKSDHKQNKKRTHSIDSKSAMTKRSKENEKHKPSTSKSSQSSSSGSTKVIEKEWRFGDTSITSENQSQNHFFDDYYTFNRLQRCKESSEYSAVIVKVVSRPFKCEDKPKIFVRVEELGDAGMSINFESCLMFWYAESTPRDANKMKPNEHYRIGIV